MSTVATKKNKSKKTAKHGATVLPFPRTPRTPAQRNPSVGLRAAIERGLAVYANDASGAARALEEISEQEHVMIGKVTGLGGRVFEHPLAMLEYYNRVASELKLLDVISALRAIAQLPTSSDAHVIDLAAARAARGHR
jgi:hypothetical protein